MRATADDELFF